MVVALVGLFQCFLIPSVLTNGSGDPAGQTFFHFFSIAYNVFLLRQYFFFAQRNFLQGIDLSGAQK